MTDLEQVRRALITLLGDESRLVMINARLILRTGVSLNSIQPHHSKDRARIAKVVGALREMGFEL